VTEYIKISVSLSLVFDMTVHAVYTCFTKYFCTCLYSTNG